VKNMLTWRMLGEVGVAGIVGGSRELWWPPFCDATAHPFLNSGKLAVPVCEPVAAGREPSVPPPPWNMYRPFQTVGRRTSNVVP
jgi:hypothetical protein